MHRSLRRAMLSASTIALGLQNVAVPKFEEENPDHTSSRFGFAEPPKQKWEHVEQPAAKPPLTQEQRKARQRLLDQMRNKK